MGCMGQRRRVWRRQTFVDGAGLGIGSKQAFRAFNTAECEVDAKLHWYSSLAETPRAALAELDKAVEFRCIIIRLPEWDGEASITARAKWVLKFLTASVFVLVPGGDKRDS